MDHQHPRDYGADNSISLWDIIRLLLSKLHLVLIAGVIVALVVFAAVKFFVTPTYESRVSFYVYNSADGESRTGTVNNNDLQAAESLAATYSKILESNSVMDAVLLRLGNGNTITRKELSRLVSVSVIDGTQLLEVVVRTNDADFSCRVANAFATAAPTEIVRITKAGGVEVVDRPEAATEKSSPRTVFDTAVGFVIGMIAASAALIMHLLSDSTVYLPEDVEKFSSVTILGQIPEITSDGGNYSPWKLTEGGLICFDPKAKER